MRRLTILVTLLVAGCATTPAPEPPPQPQQRPSRPPAGSGLVGLTAGELIQRFGQPALQVREGPGLKLQFRGAVCVLDAYLYPPVQGAGPQRVTHVDTRLPSGADTNQQACTTSLQRA